MGAIKSVERTKRYKFVGCGAAGLGLAVLVTPWLGLPLMGYGAYLGLDWFKFRAKNGMRF